MNLVKRIVLFIRAILKDILDLSDPWWFQMCYIISIIILLIIILNKIFPVLG